MSILLRTVSMATSVFLVALVHRVEAQCVTSTSECSALQKVPSKTLFEPLVGISDGRNHIFHTKGIPLSSQTTHIFRNGLELAPGTDYTLQGNTVTLEAKTVESSGDVYQVSYISGSETMPQETSDVEPKPAAEALSRFLQRSLEQELSKAPLASSEYIEKHSEPASLLQPASTSADDTPHIPNHVRSTQVTEPASLRMLSRAIRQPHRASTSKAAAARTDFTSFVADGVEGLGDHSQSSLFSTLFEKQSGVEVDSLQNGTNRLTKSQPASRRKESAALQMLQERLAMSE